MTIGGRIKKARKVKTLTQIALAEKIGVTQNTIARYETDRVVPSSAAIILICRELNVREEWLRTGAGEMLAAPTTRESEIAAAVDKALPGESEEFRRQLTKVLSKLKEEMWAVFIDKMFDILKTHRKEPQQKNASDISEAESEHINEVVNALTLSRADAIRLINAAYDRREKETLDAG